MLQRPVAIDGDEQVTAQAIVIARGGQHFNMVFHPLHAFNFSDYLGGVVLERRLYDLPVEYYVVTIELERDIVKGVEVRQRQDLVAHLFGDTLLGFGRVSRFGLSRCECRRDKKKQYCYTAKTPNHTKPLFECFLRRPSLGIDHEWKGKGHKFRLGIVSLVVLFCHTKDPFRDKANEWIIEFCKPRP